MSRLQTCLIILVPTLALAQGVTVTTDKGTVGVQTGSGTVQVKTKGNKTRVSAQGATTEVQTDAEADTGAKPTKGGGGSLADLAALGGCGGGFSVDSQNQKVSHACQPGESVAISGQGNQVALSGPCGKICVSGHKNKVTADQAESIDASGDKNQVKWKSGVSGDPKVMTSGFNNSVQKAE
jgi:hypothetical protein